MKVSFHKKFLESKPEKKRGRGAKIDIDKFSPRKKDKDLEIDISDSMGSRSTPRKMNKNSKFQEHRASVPKNITPL